MASPAMESQANLPDHLTEDILLRRPRPRLHGRPLPPPHRRRPLLPPSLPHTPPAASPGYTLGLEPLPPRLPAQPPHPSAAAARTLADTDFSCSFLPSCERPWIRHDFRDGRALFCVAPDGDDRALVREVAVCDPLHRRYLPSRRTCPI
ncbi:hypothetical protein VPH35_126851 [Triticum aestivum]